MMAQAPTTTAPASVLEANAPIRDLRASRRYCWRLATSHYENFSVVTWLAPRSARQHLANVYAYCRYADDLADESPDPRQALAGLNAWQVDFEASLVGEFRHPIFAALADTIREYSLPREPFLDLLDAFRMDQTKTRYATHEEALVYCKSSANPVGRLVLGLAHSLNEVNAALSDKICTGLQLANFCQDVANDWSRGRVYLPEETLAKQGVSERDFQFGKCNDRLRACVAEEVDRAERYLREGLALVEKLPNAWAFPVGVFAQGGKAILRAIRAANFDVWSSRPRVSQRTKLQILALATLRRCLGRKPSL